MPESVSLPPLRDVIAAYDLRARKSLGQHFLFDLNLTRKIAKAAGPMPGATFIEIGPGPGGLTRSLLLEGAERVIAIERDERCLPALAAIERAFPRRLSVLTGDALKIDETALLTGEKSDIVRIAANLPYNVGTAILVKWLRQAWPPFWSSLTLMFQREVAERIVARTSTSSYGRLSVLAQWRSDPTILFSVPRTAFTPKPKVDSCVVRFELRSEPSAAARLESLEAITAAAFGQRRKMVRQSLKSLLTEEHIWAAGIDPRARPEQLDIAELAALARALDARGIALRPAD
ncbi:MAG: 16S rRNA (adenine(1518)-N(6)/adenine(1519)-N(6))-dimethyltransferase RsmA [Alphaproteobacteria bacterium]|nr:16S rRNA (adenine(1518)-N(6)/adenine(1519)-N(6))-dimethyltransferase RsmA [Alphaproteobacteria bacterium]